MVIPILQALLTDILAQGKYLPRAALLCALVALACCLASGERQKGRWLLQRWRMGLFLFYLCFMLTSTILARQTVNPVKAVFDHLWFRDNVKWNTEIIENILLFIPYTLLYLCAFHPRKPFRAALLLSTATTLLIEGSQLTMRLGQFQFSDLIYNTLGGGIGFGIWAAGRVIHRRIRKAKP